MEKPETLNKRAALKTLTFAVNSFIIFCHNFIFSDKISSQGGFGGGFGGSASNAGKLRKLYFMWIF